MLFVQIIISRMSTRGNSDFDLKDLQIMVSPLIYFCVHVSVMRWVVNSKYSKPSKE